MIEGGDGSRDRQEAGATLDDLERGRASHRRRAWADAHRWLARADRTAPLGAGDLELLAAASYLLGRDDDYMDALDRAHRAHLDDGDHLRAAACAFWLGFRLMFRGEAARSSGWLGRAQRLVERDERDVALRGYLMLPLAEQQLAAEEREAAHRSATSAAEIGERLGDADLVAFARHMQGRARVQLGQVEDGLNLLDEAMVAVARGELSPIVTGLLYCSVIDCCHEVHALGRAREWTSALAAWCDQQPDMVAFVGVCRVHRAEIMQRSGAWSEALEEARRAHERTRASDPGTAGEALYQQA
ncbi:MAG TPA: hypothetical protein VKB80_19650 [Kofleriaceae bacterium]|nr:hypothetical protein [Kofleriaceae bacterium]